MMLLEIIVFGAPYGPEIFEKYKQQMLDICSTGEPILFQCAAAHRVGKTQFKRLYIIIQIFVFIMLFGCACAYRKP